MSVKNKKTTTKCSHSKENKLHKCATCSYETTYKSNYARHLKNHNPQMECKLCCKRYGTLFNLKKHVETHNKTDYVCEICGKICKSESGLRYHQKQHTGKGFKCDTCDKTFYTKASYVGHLSTHTGEKNYKCEDCGTAFGYPNNLHYHRKYNCKGVYKSYKCRYCDAELLNAKSLNDHIKGAHQGRMYHCRTCGKAYKWRSPLRYHEMHAHKNDSKTT